MFWMWRMVRMTGSDNSRNCGPTGALRHSRDRKRVFVECDLTSPHHYGWLWLVSKTLHCKVFTCVLTWSASACAASTALPQAQAYLSFPSSLPSWSYKSRPPLPVPVFPFCLCLFVAVDVLGCWGVWVFFLYIYLKENGLWKDAVLRYLARSIKASLPTFSILYGHRAAKRWEA